MWGRCSFRSCWRRDTTSKCSICSSVVFGKQALAAVASHPRLEQIQGDLRDGALLRKIVPGCDAVIHLACISNDPSFELDPALGKSINFDCFEDLVHVSRESGVGRFIYASSKTSVYGVKETPNVTEELPLEPLTDYSKYKRAVRRRIAALAATAGICRAGSATGDGVRLVAAAAARSVGQHSHESCGEQPQDHRLWRTAASSKPAH